MEKGDAMNFENMNAKEILQNWNKLHYLLYVYELEMEYGIDKANFTEKYQKLNLMIKKINNVLDFLPTNYQLMVKDIYINHKKWGQVEKEQKISTNTLARRLNKVYKTIDDLVD